MNTVLDAVLPVAQRGEGILTLTAAPVAEHEFGSAWLQSLADAMQVYVSKRIIIVASRPNLRYPDAPEMDAVVMVNPEILHFSEDTLLGEEGCLSVPDQRGQVARAAQIQVRYFNLDGQGVDAEFSGFPARIVQHEVDHLNGVLFVERLSE